MTRTASRPSLRFGLRVLVVGGFAGAAWFLSAASAQAAETTPPAEDASTELTVVSLVSGPDTGADERSSAVDTVGTVISPVTDIASAAAGSARIAPLADHRASATALPSAAVSATTPRTADAVVAGRDADLAATRPGGGLLGLTDGLIGSSSLLTPVTKAVDPVVAPLSGALRPVSGALLDAARPVTSALGSMTRVTTGVISPPVAQWAPLAPNGALAPDTARIPVTPVAAGAEAPVFGPRLAGDTAGSASTTSVERRPAAAEVSAAGTPVTRTGSGNLPDRPYPTPLRGSGVGAGTLASGVGGHVEGGGFAVAPSSIVESTVAIHRMRATTDVAALRHEAQAPTVSPD
ncbi:hypothetical protein WEI85_03330 [Actinomycetes bacterium KLBMP 9797]